MAKQDKTKGNTAKDLEGLELVMTPEYIAAGKPVLDKDGKETGTIAYPALGTDAEFLKGIPGTWKPVTSPDVKKYTIIVKPNSSVAKHAKQFSRLFAETEIGKDWIKEHGSIEAAVNVAAFKKFRFDLDNRARGTLQPEAKKREQNQVISRAISGEEQTREFSDEQKATLAKIAELAKSLGL